MSTNGAASFIATQNPAEFGNCGVFKITGTDSLSPEAFEAAWKQYAAENSIDPSAISLKDNVLDIGMWRCDYETLQSLSKMNFTVNGDELTDKQQAEIDSLLTSFNTSPENTMPDQNQFQEQANAFAGAEQQATELISESATTAVEAMTVQPVAEEAAVAQPVVEATESTQIVEASMDQEQTPRIVHVEDPTPSTTIDELSNPQETPVSINVPNPAPKADAEQPAAFVGNNAPAEDTMTIPVGNARVTTIKPKAPQHVVTNPPNQKKLHPKHEQREAQAQKPKPQQAALLRPVTLSGVMADALKDAVSSGLKVRTLQEGVDFINLASTSKSTLGKKLDLNAHLPFRVEELDLTVSSVGALWALLVTPAEDRDQTILQLHGRAASDHVRKYRHASTAPMKDFKVIIGTALWCKVSQHPTLAAELAANTLPMRSYYVMQDGTEVTQSYSDWYIPIIEEIADTLRRLKEDPQATPDLSRFTDAAISEAYNARRRSYGNAPKQYTRPDAEPGKWKKGNKKNNGYRDDDSEGGFRRNKNY